MLGRRLRSLLTSAGAGVAAVSANFAAGCVGLFAPLGVAISAVGLDWLHWWDVQMPILYGASALSLLALALSAWRHRQPWPLALGAVSVAVLLYPLHEGMDVTAFRLLLNGGAAGLLGGAVWNAVLLRRMARRATMKARAGHAHTPFRLWSLLIVGFLLTLPSATPAFMHQTSKIRFVQYSPAVFDQARREGKPVFMLVSAVWCYWCKYFEQHTLDVQEVADYLNRTYLNVFVDYDRRPDLVRKYVRGIPMIVLFAPDGRARQSFAGALKKEDFLAVLTRVEGEIRTELAKARPPGPAPAIVLAPSPLPVSGQTYRQFLEGLARYVDDQADATHGGFGAGSKSPHARLLAFLLERETVRQDRQRWAALGKTLEGILRGLYDPVEGGFFHYATGRDWSDPRYEKMLGVNASLVALFDAAYGVTKNRKYRGPADGTIAYLLRTLYDRQEGGFYGSQTADLGYYRLSPEQRRTARKPPVNRDKIAAANAEAIMTFLTVSRTTGRQDLTEAALRSLEFMRRWLLTDKGVYHVYDARAGRGHLRGQLEANAWAALAFLEGHRLSGKVVYREAAEQVLRYAVAELFDSRRGVFVEANDPDEPGPRAAEMPLNPNGVMALAMVRAHQVTGRIEYLEIGKRVLSSLGGEVRSILQDESDTTLVSKVADAVFYLRAYGQILSTP